MAKISPRMRTRYDKAVQGVLNLVDRRIGALDIDPNDISEVKGMFNRCIRQDQWDWFSVYSELGRPPERLLRVLASQLTELRHSVVAYDGVPAEAIVIALTKANSLKPVLLNYLSAKSVESNNTESGWLYILSTREHPNYLKIGITQRDVEERVREINSATGVLVPFSVRAVFRVADPFRAERTVFEHLAQFRIRSDREFFNLQFREAREVVRQVLNEAGLIERPTGKVDWFSEQRGYGFLTTNAGISVFLHVSEIHGERTWSPKVGDELTFDMGYTEEGPIAIDARMQ